MKIPDILTQTRQYAPARAGWNQGQGQGQSSPRPLSPLRAPARPNAGPGGRSTPPVNYYDDVDPRFAGPSSGDQHQPQHEQGYDDAHAHNGGTRSPVGSERSAFTSVSQRGVNPRWNPAPPMPQHPSHRRPVQQRQDMILDNPDFQVPGGRSGSRAAGGGRPGHVPGSAYPTGAF